MFAYIGQSSGGFSLQFLQLLFYAMLMLDYHNYIKLHKVSKEQNK
jgi:hypothetical protein